VCLSVLCTRDEEMTKLNSFSHIFISYNTTVLIFQIIYLGFLALTGVSELADNVIKHNTGDHKLLYNDGR